MDNTQKYIKYKGKYNDLLVKYNALLAKQSGGGEDKLPFIGVLDCECARGGTDEELKRLKEMSQSIKGMNSELYTGIFYWIKKHDGLETNYGVKANIKAYFPENQDNRWYVCIDPLNDYHSDRLSLMHVNTMLPKDRQEFRQALAKFWPQKVINLVKYNVDNKKRLDKERREQERLDKQRQREDQARRDREYQAGVDDGWYPEKKKKNSWF